MSQVQMTARPQLHMAWIRSPALPACIGAFALLSMAWLYLAHPAAYTALLGAWSIHPKSAPFYDTRYVAAQIECWRMGVDVYVATPCELHGEPHDYGPLWLRIPFVTTARPWVMGLGLAQSAAFLLCLAALPRARSGWQTLAVTLALLSPATVFAVERGNADLLMFVLTMLAVLALERGPAMRLLGYGAILLAGLLKLYPFVLLLTMLREPARRFGWVVAAAALLLGAYVALNLDEIARMSRNLGGLRPFGFTFGSRQLPSGLGPVLQSVLVGAGVAPETVAGIASSRLVSVPCYFALLAAGGMAAWRLARREALRAAWDALAPRERLCLFAGTALMVGCFLAGNSYAYREIGLLLAIPGLMAMATVLGVRGTAARRLSRLLHATVALALLLMAWMPPPQIERLVHTTYLFQGEAWQIALWLARELSWWGLMTVLAAVLARACLDTPTGRALGQAGLWLLGGPWGGAVSASRRSPPAGSTGSRRR